MTDEAQPAPGPVAPVYRVALTPDDVGSRVVVRRRRRDAAPGEPPLGDVLGDLVAWSGGELVIRVRTGEHVRVDERAVVAAKRVPPAPAPRGDRR